MHQRPYHQQIDSARARLSPALPRPVPRDGKAAKPLKKRTLTNLYNARPQRLSDAHAQLDAAYGWPADVADDAALSRLIRWNRLDST